MSTNETNFCEYGFEVIEKKGKTNLHLSVCIFMRMQRMKESKESNLPGKREQHYFLLNVLQKL